MTLFPSKVCLHIQVKEFTGLELHKITRVNSVNRSTGFFLEDFYLVHAYRL